MPVEDVDPQLEQDVVEHQGGDHLAGPQLGLEEGGDEHGSRSHHRGDDDSHDDMEDGGHGQVDGHRRRHQAAEEEGALPRQVELVGLEHDADAKAGEDDGDHPLQDDPEVPEFGERPDDEVIQRLEGDVADDEDKDHGHRQGQQDGGGPADDLEFQVFTHGKPSLSPRGTDA